MPTTITKNMNQIKILNEYFKQKSLILALLDIIKERDSALYYTVLRTIKEFQIDIPINHK